MKYQPTIGLEVHVQLQTKSKMFCSCPTPASNKKELQPNSLVCPTCLGHPGTLPVINKKAVKMVLKVGQALGCKIAKKSKFDRKNYFYPDLPKGYQISQYDQPLCRNGKLNKVRLKRIHLEEDTGRLIHKKDKTLIDFNRAGVPLMELVTEPDITSADQAKKFARDLQLILRYLEVSKANMEKGQMRIEVNISLTSSKIQNSKLGTKVEIKNLNSFKAVEKSIKYEIKRQSNLLKKDEKIIQETRGWQESKDKTLSQRGKEEAHDYRYFPEPDLPPLNPKKLIKEITIPELPNKKRKRFIDQFGLEEEILDVLIKNKKLADYFENITSELEKKKLYPLAANYLVKIKNDFTKVSPENMAEFIELIDDKVISSSGADKVLKKMAATGGDPTHIIDDLNLKQVSQKQQLIPPIKEVLAQQEGAIEDYKSGKKEALKFLVGQLMAKTQGKANPKMAKKIIIDLLSE